MAEQWNPPAPGLKVWYNDTDHIVAESAEDAERVWCEHVGDSSYNREEYYPFEQVDDSTQIKIGHEEESDVDDILNKAAKNGADLQGAVISRTTRGHHWARGHKGVLCVEAPAWWWALQGRCFLCSSEW